MRAEIHIRHRWHLGVFAVRIQTGPATVASVSMGDKAACYAITEAAIGGYRTGNEQAVQRARDYIARQR